MIQDIGEHRIDIVYNEKAALRESDCIIAFQGRNVYMRKRKKGIQKGSHGEICEGCRLSSFSGRKEVISSSG